MPTQEAPNTQPKFVLLAALQEPHQCRYVQCAPQATLIGQCVGIAVNNLSDGISYHMIPQLTLSRRRIHHGGAPAALSRRGIGLHEPVLFVFFMHIGILCACFNLELEPFNCMDSAASHSDHLVNQLCA